MGAFAEEALGKGFQNLTHVAKKSTQNFDHTIGKGMQNLDGMSPVDMEKQKKQARLNSVLTNNW